MIISIQRGIPGIKERLEQKGYKVVYSDEHVHPVDAHIYSSRDGAASSVHSFSMFSSLFSPDVGFGLTSHAQPFENILHGNSYSSGIVEINAAGKSFEDIERLLIQKRLTDYF